MTTPEAKLVCRPAMATDLPAIVALLNDDVYGSARNPLYADAKATYDAAFAELDGNADNSIIVGDLAGRIVGCYQLTFIRGLSHNGGLRAQIESVRVARDVRGGGIGSALIRDGINRARSRQCMLVQLTSDARRTEARAFYERLGFKASHVGMKLPL